MQLGLEPEPQRSESRFHPDTVRKAVALTQQLERHRRETLSLEQVRELAGELNLDPQLLQQALTQVSAEEARQAVAQSQTQTQSVAKQRQTKTAWVLLVIAVLLMIPLLLLGFVGTSVAPPQVAPPVRIEVQTAPAPSAPLTAPAPQSGGQ